MQPHPHLLHCHVSSLHRNLIGHLNAEIVLHTITDVSIALEWLKSTFLYIRIKQNPKHYGELYRKHRCTVILAVGYHPRQQS